MNWKATLAAVLVACAVIGSWSWWVKKGRPAKQEREEQAKRIFPELKDAEPGEVLLRDTGKPEVLLRKVDGAWRILSPVQAGVDTAQVQNLLDQLKGAKKEEVVVEQGADLREFGLDKPSGAVTFKPLSGEAKAQVLFFGSNNPTGQQAYALIDGKSEVFLTALSVKTGILKDADSLRDKTLWTFEPAEVEGVDSTLGAGFSLAKDKEGMWRLTRPVQEPAKAEDVQTFLRTLKDTRIEKFVDEEGKAPAKYGLGQGRLELRLHGQTAPLVLTRGREEGPSKSRYFQVKDRPQVFTLATYSATALEKKADDLVDKQAFSLKSWEVERFEILRDGNTLSARRRDGKWAWDPAREGDFDFDGFLSKVSGAGLLKRLPKDAKLEAVRMKAVFYGSGDAVLETAELGLPVKDGVRARSAAKHHVVEIAANVFEGLPSSAPPAPVPAATAAKK